MGTALRMRRARYRAKQIKRSPVGRSIARFGLASRAIIYLPLAGLMLDLAAGNRSGETDQGGVLRDLGSSDVGTGFLLIFAVGTVCYSLWRWAEAALGRHLEDISASDRVKAFIEGACYLPFGVMAVAVALGHSSDSQQAGHYRDTTAQIMRTTSGRVLIGAVGAVIVLVGCFLFSEGPRRSFTDDLRLERMPTFWRRLTLVLGIIGSVTRGAAFALAGVLVVVAAVTAKPAKAGGIDTAFRTVADAPLGRIVLVLAAAGIAAFGLFAVLEARWREVR